MPKSKMPTMTSVVITGRRMKGAEMLTTSLCLDSTFISSCPAEAQLADRHVALPRRRPRRCTCEAFARPP